MISIKNSSERVVILKAYRRDTLRLFPGHNAVDAKNKEELDVYFSSQAAQGYLTGWTAMVKNSQGVHAARKIAPVLSFLGYKDLDADEKLEAQAAKEKNDALNLSGGIVNGDNIRNV